MFIDGDTTYSSYSTFRKDLFEYTLNNFWRLRTNQNSVEYVMKGVYMENEAMMSTLHIRMPN